MSESACQRCAERDEDDAYQRQFCRIGLIANREIRDVRQAELDAQYPGVVARSEERLRQMQERHVWLEQWKAEHLEEFEERSRRWREEGV